MLKIENLNLHFDTEKGRVNILNDINLNFEKKKTYVLTGPNGGGKSSLAKAIIGIYKPTSGKIILDNEDITNKELYERANMGIGYAFQQPARFKGITVNKFLQLSAGRYNPIDPCGLLFDVGLCANDYMNREIDQSFSGGELKRIEIASILSRQLKVAIFDEPEAGIDLWSFQKLTETFQMINEKYDTSLIIISHQERIFRLADEVIIISKGEVSERTSQTKILEDIRQLEASCRCRTTCTRGGMEQC